MHNLINAIKLLNLVSKQVLEILPPSSIQVWGKTKLEIWKAIKFLIVDLIPNIFKFHVFLFLFYFFLFLYKQEHLFDHAGSSPAIKGYIG